MEDIKKVVKYIIILIVGLCTLFFMFSVMATVPYWMDQFDKIWGAAFIIGGIGFIYSIYQAGSKQVLYKNRR